MSRMHSSQHSEQLGIFHLQIGIKMLRKISKTICINKLTVKAQTTNNAQQSANTKLCHN